jgi:hypothetical protein
MLDTQITETSENRTVPVVEWSGFQMVLTSLDRFSNKTVIKRILFYLERSRLAIKTIWNAKWLPKHSKTRLKKRPKNDHSKTGRSRFRVLTLQ